MAERLVTMIAHNIVSPLGLTSADNFAAVTAGRSAVRCHKNQWGLPEPFAASLIDHEVVNEACKAEGVGDGLTFFERMAVLSIKKALQECDVDITSEKTLVILSTTKGNVDLLRVNDEHLPANREYPGEAAKAICQALHYPNKPLVVSNACVSGVCAQIEAYRQIKSGHYDVVVVCGADVLGPFIVSGFQSLKALSSDPCRPFDEDRTGINLGDAAATCIFKGVKADEIESGSWILADGVIRNDAFHIASPAKNGEGCYRALTQLLHHVDKDDLACINAHGTATLFNDEMEAVALTRAGLSDIPVNSLKGYFGHTLGAAGVLETIITMLAVEQGMVIGTRGFKNLGVSRPIKVSAQHEKTDKSTFIKMLSGFGGCNAALLYRRFSR
ncbi:MAG: beta-ketoacyl-[acyl-carrier-protein] synthase family protein [Prevotella sp.]